MMCTLNISRGTNAVFQPISFQGQSFVFSRLKWSIEEYLTWMFYWRFTFYGRFLVLCTCSGGQSPELASSCHRRSSLSAVCYYPIILSGPCWSAILKVLWYETSCLVARSEANSKCFRVVWATWLDLWWSYGLQDYLVGVLERFPAIISLLTARRTFDQLVQFS